MTAFTVAWIFSPVEGHGYDFESFRNWAIQVREHGLSHAYELSSLDYNPLYVEFLWVYGRLVGSVHALRESFHSFKIAVLLFDFGVIGITAYLLRRNGRNIALACFLLFNPAFFYDTLLWGQVDAIFTMFVVLAIALATRKHVIASLVSVLIAVNFKLYGIVFLPLVVLLNLPAILEKPKKLLGALALMVVVQLLIFLPFLGRDALAAIITANKRQFAASAATSPSAYNFWYIVCGEFAYNVPATKTALGITCKTWGVVLFAITTAVALLPLFKVTVLRKKRLGDGYVFLACAIYSLAFYFFTTGMHERYSHPAMVMLGISAVLTGNYATYVLGSIAYFLNVEQGLKFFSLAKHDVFITKGPVIGWMFAVVLVTGVLKIYLELRSSESGAREVNEDRSESLLTAERS